MSMAEVFFGVLAGAIAVVVIVVKVISLLFEADDRDGWK